MRAISIPWFLWVFFAGCFLSMLEGSVFRAGMDRAIREAAAGQMEKKRFPGAVIRIDHGGEAYEVALGSRALVPRQEPMSVDTVFDLASLTKVVATTSAVMKLVEEGKIDPEGRVVHYLPEFTGGGKESIKVRHLLTHISGLPPGIAVNASWQGKDGAYGKICGEQTRSDPGTKFVYSDLNFILLGLLVEKVTGRGLDDYCQREIFGPLGMTETLFRPAGKIPGERLAPTERLSDGTVLRGVVHDPTARRMGGVAGHAGLFSTVRDLALFTRMLLEGGQGEKARIFKPETVRLMTSVATPDGLPRRGLGWDIDSPFTGQRGALFPVGGFGHTGWTGTSLWIDPFSRTSVILLSNRNHPRGGNVLPFQRELGTLAARGITDFNFAWVPDALPPAPAGVAPPLPAGMEVANGIDVLRRDGFQVLRGRKVGLVTNQTGLARDFATTIDLLHQAPGVELKALFSPEHGIRGELDHDGIPDGRDAQTGLPIYSLYGEHRRPVPSQLAGLDALVYDIQGVGCRFYTYLTTMIHCMEEAGKAGLKFFVLDRVNPIGSTVEGPLQTEPRSFIGAHEIPLRHGLTMGELATLVKRERKLDLDLQVIRCAGGSPFQWYDRTGLPWCNPSPNMRSATQALLYPGVGMLEFCNLSVGRGTDTPFEIIGAPYVDEFQLAAAMNAAGLPGLSFTPLRFTPAASKFAREECHGVRFTVVDREAVRAAELGVVLAKTLNRLWGEKFEAGKMLPLLGDKPTLDAILADRPLAEIRDSWTAGLREFELRRKDALLYPR